MNRARCFVPDDAKLLHQNTIVVNVLARLGHQLTLAANALKGKVIQVEASDL